MSPFTTLRNNKERAPGVTKKAEYWPNNLIPVQLVVTEEDTSYELAFSILLWST